MFALRELHFSSLGVSQYLVLQVGQILGIPGLRGNHVLPHLAHLCSLITSMS